MTDGLIAQANEDDGRREPIVSTAECLRLSLGDVFNPQKNMFILSQMRMAESLLNSEEEFYDLVNQASEGHLVLDLNVDDTTSSLVGT